MRAITKVQWVVYETDVVMPGMNVVDLAERARLIRPEMKLLFMSGYTDRAPKLQDLTEKGMPLHQKPFTRQGLLHKVREVLEIASECV